MKLIKMLNLAMVAAIAAMAFIGTGSAGAKTLPLRSRRPRERRLSRWRVTLHRRSRCP